MGRFVRGQFLRGWSQKRSLFNGSVLGQSALKGSVGRSNLKGVTVLRTDFKVVSFQTG